MKATTDAAPSEQFSLDFDAERLAEAGRQHKLQLIILYGSYAKDLAKTESDVDIAVLGCPADAFWECYESLSALFPRHSLDMVRLEDADPLFRYEVMRDAVLLYGDPDMFCEYRAFAFRDFIDSADLFALEDTLFRKKMARMKERLHGSP